MKRFFVILLAIVSVFAIGKPNASVKINTVDTLPTGFPQIFNFPYVQFKGYVRVDSGLLMPMKDTNFIPLKAALIVRTADTSLYFYNNRKWNKLLKLGDGVGETDPTVSALVKSINATDTSNWNTAYRKRVSAITYDSASRILSLALADGTIVSDTIKYLVSAGSDGNNYPTAMTYNTGTQTLTLNRNGLSALSVVIPGTGEINTGSNVGTGATIFQAKVGEDLRFKTVLSANSNIVIANNTNDITLTGKSFVDSVKRATGNDSVKYYIGGTAFFAYKDSSAPAASGEVNTGSNLGLGSQVFESKVGVDLRFRSLTTDTTIIRTQNTNDIELKVDQTRIASVPRLRDSVALRVRYTDTSAMLATYLRKFDTTAMLLPYLRKVDTTGIRPQLVAGTNITITGTYPNLTITGATGATINLSRTQGTQSVVVTPSGGGTSASIDSADAARAGTLTAHRYRQIDTLINGDSLRIAKKFGSDSVFVYTSPFPYTVTDSSFAFVDGGTSGGDTLPYFNAQKYGVLPTNSAATNSTNLDALAAIVNLKGGEIYFPSGEYFFSRTFRVPDSGDSIPVMKNIKIRGASNAFVTNGSDTDPRGGTILSFNTTDSIFIDSRGRGVISIENFTIWNKSATGGKKMFRVTSSTPRVQGVTFFGRNGLSSADDDAIVLGGENVNIVDSSINSPFQGYGAYIVGNYAQKIRAFTRLNNYANAAYIVGNTIWNQSGGESAFYLDGDPTNSTSGNVIMGNTIEMVGYEWGFKLRYANKNVIKNNHLYDESGTIKGAISFDVNSSLNIYEMGYEDTKGYVKDTSDNNTIIKWGQGDTSIYIGKTWWREDFYSNRGLKTYNNNYTNYSQFNTYTGATSFEYNADLKAALRYTGTNTTFELSTAGPSTFLGLGSRMNIYSATGNEMWIGDQTTQNHLVLNGVMYARGNTGFKMSNNSALEWSGTTSPTAGTVVALKYDSTGQLVITDGASSNGQLKVGKIYATAPAQYAANYGSAFTNRSLVDKNYVDSSISAIVVATEGTYTPTLTNVTNIASSTSGTFHYQRIGNYVYVTGEITIDPTAAGDTQVDLSLPISSVIANTYDLTGHGDSYDFLEPSRVYGQTTNNRAILRFSAVSLTSRVVGISFRYKYVAP